jgi:hypothetical protein
MKHLRFILLVLFIIEISVFNPIQAKKITMPIEILIGTADLIVIGEISKFYELEYKYDLKVTDIIKGECKGTITVKNFEEWTCDYRYQPVEAGEVLMLFLKKKGRAYEIINGSTGEIPIIDSCVILENEEFEHIDYEFSPYELSFEEFFNGVTKFSSCFSYSGNFYDNIWDDKMVFKRKCQSFSATTEFEIWLEKRLSKYQLI